MEGFGTIKAPSRKRPSATPQARPVVGQVRPLLLERFYRAIVPRLRAGGEAVKKQQGGKRNYESTVKTHHALRGTQHGLRCGVGARKSNQQPEPEPGPGPECGFAKGRSPGVLPGEQSRGQG